MINRRSLILGASALIVAPAIVRVESLMRVSPIENFDIDYFIDRFDFDDARFFTDNVTMENVILGNLRMHQELFRVTDESFRNTKWSMG